MIDGAIFVGAAVLAFLVPLAIPFVVRRWRAFVVILVLGVAFFGWLYWDLQRAILGGAPSHSNWFGGFLGGLIALGFGIGAIAKFAMLLAQLPATKEPPHE